MLSSDSQLMCQIPCLHSALVRPPSTSAYSSFNTFPRNSDTINELDDILPLYIDSYTTEEESLKLNATRVQQLLDSQVESGNISEIQQRMQLLVFQSPVQSIALALQPHLIGEYSEEQSISQFFMNEDFPILLNIQPILASIKCAQEEGEQATETIDESNEIVENLKKQKVHLNKATTPRQLKDLLLNIFNEFRGRIPNLFRPLMFFAGYMDEFFQAFSMVFSAQSCSPWQEHSLYVLGMLTASAYENAYVFSLFADLYEAYDTTFLEQGYEVLDAKTKKAWDLILFLKENSPIRMVADVTLMKDLYSELLNTWSHGDLTFAIIAISFAQQLVMLSQGFGIINESFSTQILTNMNPSSNSSSTHSGSSSNQSSKKPSESEDSPSFIPTQRKQVERLTQEVVDILQQRLLTQSISNAQGEHEEDEQQEQQHEQEISSANLDEDQLLEINDDLPVNIPQAGKKFKKYTGPVEASRYIVKQRRSQRKCLWQNQYTWKEHVFEFLSQRYPALEKLLSKKLAVVQDLTLRSFGSVTEIDTQIFRTAIWKYCELSMGYVDPSYDYSNVNTLLKKPLRNFLNKLIFKPKEVKIADLNALPYLFETHDLIHLIILAAEAKFYTQITLLFHSLQQSTK